MAREKRPPERTIDEEASENEVSPGGSSVGWSIDRRDCLKLAGLAGGALLGSTVLGSTSELAPIGSVTAYAGTGERILNQSRTRLAIEETEPNDDPSSATRLDVNTPVRGSLEATGTDWFAVDLSSETEIRIECTRSRSDGVAAVALYDTEGEFTGLATGSDSAPAVLERTTSAAGTHFVQVVDINAGRGEYTLVVIDESKDTPSSTPTPSPTPTSTPDPKPASTTIWFEAEAGTQNETFPPLSIESDENASGGKYVAATGESRYGEPREDGYTEYIIEVPEEGTYWLWGRVIAPDGGSNSFWVSIDGGYQNEWWLAREQDMQDNGGVPEWTWLRLNDRNSGTYPVELDLEAGEHTVRVTHRESGTKLDRLVLSDNPEFEPSGTGTGRRTPTPEPTPTPTPEPTPEPTPQPTVFPLALEAEGASGGSKFEPFEVRSDENAVGNRYIVVPDGTGPRQTSPPDRGQATYTVEIPEDGEYSLWARVRPTSSGNSFYFGVDDEDPIYWDAPLSDEWIWTELGRRDGPKQTLSLSEGTHNLMVYWREDGMELDRLVLADDLSFEPSGAGPEADEDRDPTPTPTPEPTPTPTPTPDDGQNPHRGEPQSLPDRIEAENYDQGGEGIAYSDADEDNNGGAYRDGAVDIQDADDSTGGQYNVGWMEDGEYLEYTLTVPEGTYEMRARVAARNDAGELRARLGNTEIGTVSIPTTGGWQDWTTVTVGSLSIENTTEEILRLDIVGGDYNLNWFAFVEAEEDGGGTPTPTPNPSPTPSPTPDEPTVNIGGDLKTWHNAQLTFNGPVTSENSDPNPFLDYRLNVTFTGPSGQSYEVPGYYAADGNAAETGSSSGRKWRVRFAPDEAGEWSFTASFRKGERVAVKRSYSAGSPIGFDGASGTFSVGESDKSGRDFRSKGMLTNQGSHYYQFPDGTRWLKAGPDIPENFLAHGFGAHGGRHGALDYVADRGANCIYFLPNNVGGDGDDTWPHTQKYGTKTRYDTSKLQEWESLFRHAEKRGILLHFQLAETESGNENYYDGGDLGPERKLFYRELIARFGHICGIEWDLGEENDYGTDKRERFAEYITDIDPYDHVVTNHTHSGNDGTYDPLVGNSDFDATGFQGGWSRGRMANLVQEWRRKSSNAGVPWIIEVNEPQRIEADANDRDDGLPHGRIDKMWPLFMSGGGGFEWYIQRDGGGHGLDQAIDDFDQIEEALTWSGYLLDFFDRIPYWKMEANHGAVSNGDGYLLDGGDIVAVYLPDGDTVDVDIDAGQYTLTWFDPESGATKSGGTISGGNSADLPSPPFSGDTAGILQR